MFYGTNANFSCEDVFFIGILPSSSEAMFLCATQTYLLLLQPR